MSQSGSRKTCLHGRILHRHNRAVPSCWAARCAGRTAGVSGGFELRSYEIRALPLVNAFLERMLLTEMLAEHLPPDDPRTELPTVEGARKRCQEPKLFGS